MRNDKLRTVRLKAGYWSHEDDDEQGCIFHISGLTPDEKKVQLQVGGFTPFIYLELPSKLKWNETKCKAVFDYFQGLMKANGPIRYKMYEKYKLHFKKRTNTMFMTFPSWKACREFGYKCSRIRSAYIPKVGSIYGGDFIVHEQNIDAIIKFTAAKKIPLAGWIEVKEKIPSDEESLTEEERKFSSADIDLYSHFSQVKHCTEENAIVNPEYCSFDGEMYSKNHNAKLSDPDIKENVVFQISMIFGRLNNQKREKYLLTLFDPLDIEDVNVIRCKTEKELLLKFTSLIKEKDPDLFIGYNIMKFDWGYLIARAEKLGIYPRFMELSRIIGRRAELKKNSWSSSAYGDQEFRYPDCHGRINMDVILEVERNYRMPEYGLNAVADKFLGEKKDPVTARHMFMLYQMTEELLPIVRGKTLTEREVKRIRKHIQELLLLRFFKNAADEIKEYRKRLLTATTFNIEDTVREAMTIIGKYCVKDSVLPIDLAEKLNLYTTMEQMSNVMHVPMSYLHTRGQQIKVLAQVYRETIANNMIIPYRNKNSDEDEKYQGAIVIEANPGDYDNVCMLDFASLYPSMMITYNICYSTILEDSNPVPDSECHILDWEDHCGCEHDPQKRKKKKEDVMCGSHHYRFRKVIIGYDEESGEITRKHEGLMPRLERNLLASRKIVKKEMFKAEARLKMQRGQATEKNIEYYQKIGLEIIEKGSLGPRQEMMLEVTFNVLNAKQLAIKVSANSVDEDAPIPCLISGKVEYRKIKDLFGKEYTVDDSKNEVSKGPEGVLVWSDGGWSEIKYVFRHKTSEIMRRVITANGCVDVTDDHSLLYENGKEGKASEIKEGESLLHIGVPLPEDTPSSPRYPEITVEQAESHELDSNEDRKACKEGLFFADYTNTDKTAVIPDYILNAPYNTRLSFFCGYCSQVSQEKTFTISTKLESAKFFHLLRSLKYHAMILRISDNDEYVFFINGVTPRNGDNKIRSIKHLLKYIPGGMVQGNIPHHYVYDIETSTHHFAAGVGNMIVHNSAYGAMGAKTGFIPFIPGAASVTAMGRKLITMAIDKIKATWNISKLVYGDSVTSDTPVLCRSTNENGIQKVFMTPISQLPRSVWLIFPDGKCYSNPLNNLEVWSDKGFTKIKSIMKHKTNKKIYRITSHTGVVKVTEDHSLLYDNEDEVRPKDVSVGENLLTKSLPPVEGTVDYSDISWAWGLFYGDGSCGYYDCPSGKKYSWAINNQNKDYLSKAKDILECYYPNHGFKILETMKSSSVYKLVCTGKVSEIVKEWREMFYDPETRHKTVPNILWSTNIKTREDFFEGYYCADGDKDKHGYTRFDNKGDIGSAGLFYLGKSLGYKASCNTRKDKLDITRITLTKNSQRKKPGVIKKIEDFGQTDDYVYDLETENHHFSAGVGELVVHNTDSCLFKFLGCNLEESFEMAEKASSMTTHYLKCNVMEIPEDYSVTTVTNQSYTLNKINSKHEDFANLSYEDKIKVVEYESIPIDLEFESMYGRLLLLTKKRYVAYIVNKKGEIIDLVKKGVVLARRDNSGYLRLAYKKLTDHVLDQKSEEDIMVLLYDEVHKLFTRKVPDTQLIIYMGVKSVMSYAKKKENKTGNIVTDVYYLDRDKIPIDDPIGPLDPRLDYPNLPQCLLSLKMMRRGTDIPPNTRLEFLYLENPDASHQGDKAEDYTYYIENKEEEEFKPDYLHYIEKQLSRPVTELLSVKYPREPILYEKLEDAFKRVLISPDLNSLKRSRLARITIYEKSVDPYEEEDVIIGWKVFSEILLKTHNNYGIKLADKRDMVYKFKNKEAKATFVVDSSRKRGMNEFNPSRSAEAELIDICKKWKSRTILDKLYKQHGIKKRPCKRPTQSGEKLRKNTKVILTQSFKNQEKGSHAKVIDFRETEDKRYYYDLLMNGREEIITKDVPRRILATYYLRDNTIMKDILNARTHYKSVVEHLDDLFDPFYFEE